MRVDPDYPNLAYGEDAKRSMIAKAVITASGVKSVSFLPVLIDKQLRPEVLRNARPAVCGRRQVYGLDVRRPRPPLQGDEVVVDTAKTAR